MTALAIVQPQWRADRIKLIAVTNTERVKAAPRSRRRGSKVILRWKSKAWQDCSASSRCPSS